MPKYPNPVLAYDSIHNPVLEPQGQRTAAHYRSLAFDQGGLPDNGGHDPTTSAQTLGKPSNEGGGGFLPQSLGASDDEENGEGGAMIDTKTASALHDAAHQSGASEPDLQAFARVLSILCGKNSNPLAGPTANDEENEKPRGRTSSVQGHAAKRRRHNGRRAPAAHARVWAGPDRVRQHGNSGDAATGEPANAAGDRRWSARRHGPGSRSRDRRREARGTLLLIPTWEAARCRSSRK